MTSYSSSLSDQSECSICLDVFTEPVSIPCRHIFCKACIGKYWDDNKVYACPSCKIRFYERPDVKAVISEVAPKCSKSAEVKAKPVDVACHVCTGTKLKALKSCLECLTSYCEKHLESHQKVMGLKRHKLIDPVENVEDRMCMKHDRLLEIFCKTDQVCVCQFCVAIDHKNHVTVPLEVEYREWKDQLEKKDLKVKQMIQERELKVQEVKQSVEQSKRDTEKDIAEREQIFTALASSIERSQAEYINVAEEKQKTAERQAEGLIKQLDQEVTELQRRHTKLEDLLHTEDQLHLLQKVPCLDAETPTKDWSQVSVNKVVNEEDVRKSLRGYVSQLEAIVKRGCSELMDKFDKEKMKLTVNKLKWMQQYAVDVTLDPDTANNCLVLSEDGKQVRDGDRNQNVPHNPTRFSSSLTVLGKEGYTSGRLYYEVTVTGKTRWRLGVARESVNRKSMAPLFPENGLWVVGLKDGGSFTSNTSATNAELTLKKKPQKVGVFVDYEEGQVSFYDVDASSEIYTFTGQTFSEKLYPYFNTCGNDSGKNSAPLVIPPVVRSDATYNFFTSRFWYRS